ncbi:hypothetical protein SAMN06264855_105111 [Halorubrum vacuolatum]|uniref:Uncharacterized protein n=1 Tax=Halorubrum vacuolatum TaxID=63740 RepID=A0A238W4B1_HALVU|nr:hypothetical protein SAMN06264855_105111 [Halorubrum vacuolatum]
MDDRVQDRSLIADFDGAANVIYSSTHYTNGPNPTASISGTPARSDPIR